jgi:hypothetical protein
MKKFRFISNRVEVEVEVAVEPSANAKIKH